jgi:hypothetical protein
VSVLVIERVVTKVVDEPFSSVVVKVVATVSTVVEAQSSQDIDEDVVASATGVEEVVSAATGVDEVVFQSSQVTVGKVDSAGAVVEASATGVKLVLLYAQSLQVVSAEELVVVSATGVAGVVSGRGLSTTVVTGRELRLASATGVELATSSVSTDVQSSQCVLLSN